LPLAVVSKLAFVNAVVSQAVIAASTWKELAAIIANDADESR
jgi:hypothetical protein